MWTRRLAATVLCTPRSSTVPPLAMLLARTASSLVQADELYSLLTDPNVLVIDATQNLCKETNTVSPARERYEQGHVPGSVFVDVGGRLSAPGMRNARGDVLHNMAPTAEGFAAGMRQIGVDDSTHVVVYSSRHVMWATRMWWLLDSFGFQGRVSVLDGGLQAWHERGLPLESGSGAVRSPSELPTRPARTGAFVDKERVREAIDDQETLLIDTLKKASFEGVKASRYGRRGHIATALSLPYPTVVCPESGCFFDGDAIQTALATAGVRLGSAGTSTYPVPQQTVLAY